MALFSNNTTVKVGSLLPGFQLLDQYRNEVKSLDLIGKSNLVIFFYPMDMTPGCTKEACGFRDKLNAFTELNTRIIGISSDNPESHHEFSIIYELPFTLLSDEDKAVRKLFNVPNDIFGLIPGRVTYVFDLKGKCVEIFDSQLKPLKHVNRSLEVLTNI